MSSGNKYSDVLGDISSVIQKAKQAAARSVNSMMTASYWVIGRRLVEFEQKGKTRADYGKKFLKQLTNDACRPFQKQGRHAAKRGEEAA